MWKCQKCNEELEDVFDACWNCGTRRDGEVITSSNKKSFRRIQCPNCETQNLIKANYCNHCGCYLHSDTIEFGTSEYAGFLSRFFALIIDGFIFAAFFIPINLVLGLYVSYYNEHEVLQNVVTAFLYWGYFAGFESSKWQATPGKLIIGMRVVDYHRKHISFGKATLRYFGKFISLFILCIGFIMIAFTKKRQGLHDLMVETLVIHNDVKKTISL